MLAFRLAFCSLFAAALMSSSPAVRAQNSPHAQYAAQAQRATQSSGDSFLDRIDSAIDQASDRVFGSGTSSNEAYTSRDMQAPPKPAKAAAAKGEAKESSE